MEDEDKEDFAAGDAEEADPEITAAEQGRSRRGFIRKVLSPIIGYGADYFLLHFVFDLSMWTTVGTKKNLAARTGVALRHLLHERVALDTAVLACSPPGSAGHAKAMRKCHSVPDEGTIRKVLSIPRMGHARAGNPWASPAAFGRSRNVAHGPCSAAA